MPSLLLAAAVAAAFGLQPPAPGAPTDTAARPDSPRSRTDSARARALEAVTVTAVRGADAPVARTTLGRPALERAYTGQDVPLLLQQAPAVTTYAQSGSQWNYSYFRLRGIDQSRINLTLDGIPLNEPEDQQLYFSNFADLANSIRSVQVQRGVGTSTYGQASFGGSVNFESEALAGARRGGELQLGGGSFGAARAAVEYATGPLPGGAAFYGRFSNQRADGYRRGSGHAGNSAFLSGGYLGTRDLLKVTLLTGAESNGQAYTPVPLDELRADPRANPIAGVGDRFRQSMAAVAYTRLLTPSASLQTTVYGFDAGGRYDYPSWVAGARDPRWELASRWGGLVSAAHVVRGAATLDAGVHASTYRRDHTFDARPDLDSPGYANRGHKTEASAFAKASHAVGALTLFGDVQVREATFRYQPTAGTGLSDARASWRFVNPRAGVTWHAGRRLSLFGSYGVTGREPTRADLLAGADDVGAGDPDALLRLARVRPERVRDVEFGADYAAGGFALRANGYAMEFRDEIALTGETTPLGYDVRGNVGASYRRGVELDATWRPADRLTLGGTLAASRSRITRGALGAPAGRDVPPALTPALVAGQQVTWHAAPWATLTLDGRYQSRQHLDQTGDRARTAPAFFVLDGGTRLRLGRAELLVQGRNLLDRLAFTAGDVSGAGVPRYFILAPRNVEVTARLAF